MLYTPWCETTSIPYTLCVASYYCYICVLVLRDMRPHAAIYTVVRDDIDTLYAICGLILLLYMCPRTTRYASSCCYIHRGARRHRYPIRYMWPHTTAIYVSSYYEICVLMLLYTPWCETTPTSSYECALKSCAPVLEIRSLDSWRTSGSLDW
jgi:hypothetical protein